MSMHGWLYFLLGEINARAVVLPAVSLVPLQGPLDASLLVAAGKEWGAFEEWDGLREGK